MQLPLGYILCPACDTAYHPKHGRCKCEARIEPETVTEQPVPKYEAGKERELQREIGQYLRLHSIWYDTDSSIKKRRGTVGCPDFLFVYRGVPIGCEAKAQDGRLSPDQISAHAQMEANGWRIVIAYSVADLQSLMRDIDQKLCNTPVNAPDLH